MNAAQQISSQDEQQATGRNTGGSRLLPSVTFGARTAVLAGVVAATCMAAAPAATPTAAARPAAHAVTTVALGGAISGLATPADTTWGG